MMNGLKKIKQLFKEQMPDRASLEQDPIMGRVASHVLDPDLWHTKRDYVIRAVSIGLFWAFITPFGQMFFAAIHSVWWRANVPIAVALTWITNPFTVGFWLVAAFQIGKPILDVLNLGYVDQPLTLEMLKQTGWHDVVRGVGLPAFTGMLVFALFFPLLSYLGMSFFYALRYRLLRYLRRQRKKW